jgi:putative ABC transport system substrate-binding protein
MKRRDFMAGAVSFAAASRVAAQSIAMQRLALVDVSSSHSQMQADSPNLYEILFSELRRLGHIEGQNLIVERYGREQNLPSPAALAAQVVRNNPDVIYALVPGAFPFKTETSKVPIVTVTGDPVATGLIQSLSHPGGNITGVSVDAGLSIHGKRIALLREMFPAMSKLACIAGRKHWESGAGDQVQAAAEAARMPLVSVLVDLPGSAAIYRDAVAQAVREGSDAIMVLDNPDVLTNRVSIAESIAELRIPAIHAFAGTVDAGGLMAYSFDLKELIKRVAADIDVILRGASPADVPFYQLSKFELSINLKAAKALGLTVPMPLLASADKVIE